ncbi:MAG TPA: hypothetical protein VF586_17740, partial [Pyrinomonadaceae bacterium]
RFDKLLPTAAVCLLRLVVVCSVVAAAAAASPAQTQAGSERAAAPARATADEEFDLNIERRRIGEKEFHAETAVETDGARGLRLGVGVALRASDIEVLLLGVRGHVRFRGSLAPVLRLLEARRAAPTQTPPP